MDSVWSSLLLILVLVLVMAAAYFTTKFLSRKTMRINRGRYLNIKDRVYAGKDKYIMLLEAGEQYYLIGVTNQSINLIGTLKKEEIKQEDAQAEEVSAFDGLKGFFSKISGVVKNAGNAQEELKKARLKAKIEKDAEVTQRSREEQDEIDKILNAIKQRKSRNGPKGEGR